MNVKNDDDEIKLLCEDRSIIIKYLQILLFLHATYTNYYYIIIISIIVRREEEIINNIINNNNNIIIVVV